MRSKEMLLIGTVHNDPEGFESLSKVLRENKPVHIAVEVSPYGLSYRNRHGRLLQAILARRIRRLEKQTRSRLRAESVLRSIREKFRAPFEYRAALRYCRESGAALHAIDLSSLSKELIEDGWHELIEVENITKSINYSSDTKTFSVEQEYLRAERLLKEDSSMVDVFLSPWTSQVIYEEREAHLAGALVDLHSKMEAGCLVHVGGWQHLLDKGGFKTLFQRLSHLNPRRLLLPHALKTGTLQRHAC